VGIFEPENFTQMNKLILLTEKKFVITEDYYYIKIFGNSIAEVKLILSCGLGKSMLTVIINIFFFIYSSKWMMENKNLFYKKQQNFLYLFYKRDIIMNQIKEEVGINNIRRKNFIHLHHWCFGLLSNLMFGGR
jgi:hypothetical protein